MISKLIDFINVYGTPKSIGTDKGKEFKNFLMNNFYEKNIIEIVHRFPNKAHSQGVEEQQLEVD